MRRTEALRGVRMAVFLNLLRRWESAELNQAEAAELLGVSERTFRRWTRAYEEEGEGGLVARRVRPGAGRPGGGGGAPLPRALPGLHGQALPRASGEGPWLRLGLHLAEAAPAMGGRRAKGPAQGRPSEEARAAAFAGHDAAPGWLAARLARRPSAARSDRDPG